MTMTREEQVALVVKRFVQRDNAYARQWYNPRRKDGGYVKVVTGNCPPGSNCPRGGCEHKTLVPLRGRVIADHLDGKITIGVYQLSDDDRVRWICFDIDKDKDVAFDAEQLHAKAQAQTRLLARACQRFGLHPLVEDSGNRGYHVWVFTDSPIDANKARAIGELILTDLAVEDGLHIELFPKQVAVKSLGNLVKLPLGIHQKSQRRSVFVDRHFAPLKDQFAALATIPLFPADQIDHLIGQHHLVVEPIRRVSTTHVDPWTPKCLTNMLASGISDGARDIGTFKVACYLRDKGIPQALVESMLMHWDDALNDPPLGPLLISMKVNSAFSDAYAWYPCGEYALDRYCESSCSRWQKKQEQRRFERRGAS